MIRAFIFLFTAFIMLFSCQSNIKNPDATVEVEEGAKILETNTPSEKKDEIVYFDEDHPALGNWVGYFRDADEGKSQKTLVVDEGFIWRRENKINISIDLINGLNVSGHSIVAGNDRPFKGTVTKVENGKFRFLLSEPGDHKYDGEFSFVFSEGNLIETRIEGTWTAYREIDVRKRKYILSKKVFSYNPDTMLKMEKRYVDWSKEKQTIEEVEYDDGEFEEWVSSEFASATNLIYKLNASNTLLTKEVVENLKRGDLTIIRNTIYARHGYSFKSRPLRVFFDAQPWYIPVHTNIKNDFTDIEKKNIELLLKYEKNASEYYDRFGRG